MDLSWRFSMSWSQLVGMGRLLRAKMACKGIVLSLILSFGIGFAGQGLAQTQIPLELDKSIRQLVSKHPTVAGLKVDVEYLDSKVKIPSCSGPIDVALPARVRPWGRVTLQLRCKTGKGWFLSLPIKVSIYGEYVLTTRFIQSGYKISQADLRIAEGDLSAMPDDLIRSVGEAVGRQVLRPIQAGSYISLNNLKEPSVIRVGDRVRVRVIGLSFQATGEGVAQTAGSVNEIIKVRLPDGQVLQGKISAPGVVEINIE
jgi:flagella basal body P-ring formation protein FlgA